MKFLIFVAVAVLALAQAKFLMSPNSPSGAMKSNRIKDDPLVQAAMQSEKLYIPMSRYMECDDAGCDAVCQALGYSHGVCVISTTCYCYK